MFKLSTYDNGVRSTGLDGDDSKLFNIDDTNGVLKKAKRPYGDGKGRKKRGRERDRDRWLFLIYVLERVRVRTRICRIRVSCHSACTFIVLFIDFV
jgi:hypothetical protein